MKKENKNSILQTETKDKYSVAQIEESVEEEEKAEESEKERQEDPLKDRK